MTSIFNSSTLDISYSNAVDTIHFLCNAIFSTAFFRAACTRSSCDIIISFFYASRCINLYYVVSSAIHCYRSYARLSRILAAPVCISLSLSLFLSLSLSLLHQKFVVISLCLLIAIYHPDILSNSYTTP